MGDEAAQSFEKRLSKAKMFPFITDRSDVECYFLNANHLHTLNPTVAAERIQQLIDQATQETASKSIEAIINQRTSQAFKERQNGGSQPNHGAISTKAHEDYSSDQQALRRGKHVLGRVIALLQQEMQSNPRIFEPTQYLHLDRLKAIADAIWAEGQ